MIVPGLIEAHMHPQITGILWQGVYVGRFDRTAPDGTLVNGLDTKEAVVERLKDAAAKLPADGRWLVGWGYQPEFYGESPLTRADLDPSFGGVKFVVDGSIQGYTGLFQWPGYYKTFANGIANISQDDLTKWVTEVHKRGFQAVIHTNADEATEMALTALTEAERQYPQLATRHRLEHNQYVTQSQLLRMTSPPICSPTTSTIGATCTIRHSPGPKASETEENHASAIGKSHRPSALGRKTGLGETQ